MVKEILEQFVTLQKYDTRIFEIESILAEIPKQIKSFSDKLEKSLNEKNEAETKYEALKEEFIKADSVASNQKELLEKAQKKLSSVQNSKEYEAALKELDLLKKNITEETARAKTLSEEMTGIDSIIKNKTAESSDLESSYLKEKETKEDENRSLFDELEKLKTERAAFEKNVKNINLSKYERIRSARNNIAIVEISEEVCTGCYMKIPPQMSVEVKKEISLMQCPNCQRFLHFSPEKKAE